MHTCPNCQTGWYSTYANGVKEEGYCQHCGHETSVETKKRDKLPFIVVERPQSKNTKIRRTK